MSLNDDPRWRRLQDREITCASCGKLHQGLFDLVAVRPDHWPAGLEHSSNSAAQSSKNFLSEDFCVLNGEYFFVRCVLFVPIIGGDGQHLGYGSWSTLSQQNFESYMDTFDDGEQDKLGPWFGWFSNRLHGYPDTLNLKCQVQPQSKRQRPIITLEPTDHPLAREQRDGITLDRLLEIYAVNGHDMRAALTD